MKKQIVLILSLGMCISAFAQHNSKTDMDSQTQKSSSSVLDGKAFLVTLTDNSPTTPNSGTMENSKSSQMDRMDDNMKTKPSTSAGTDVKENKKMIIRFENGMVRTSGKSETKVNRCPYNASGMVSTGISFTADCHSGNSSLNNGSSNSSSDWNSSRNNSTTTTTTTTQGTGTYDNSKTTSTTTNSKTGNTVNDNNTGTGTSTPGTNGNENNSTSTSGSNTVITHSEDNPATMPGGSTGNPAAGNTDRGNNAQTPSNGTGMPTTTQTQTSTSQSGTSSGSVSSSNENNVIVTGTVDGNSIHGSLTCTKKDGTMKKYSYTGTVATKTDLEMENELGLK